MTPTTTDTIAISTTEDAARRHARQGIFWPPYGRVARPNYNQDQHAGMEAYSKAYWDEYHRLRLERGAYDLL